MAKIRTARWLVVSGAVVALLMAGACSKQSETPVNTGTTAKAGGSTGTTKPTETKSTKAEKSEKSDKSGDDGSSDSGSSDGGDTGSGDDSGSGSGSGIETFTIDDVIEVWRSSAANGGLSESMTNCVGSELISTLPSSGITKQDFENVLQEAIAICGAPPPTIYYPGGN